MQNASYKPLLFNTTVRNPERIKAFLAILHDYNGQLLTDEIIEKVAISAIKIGLYQPMQVAVSTKLKWKHDIDLADGEAAEVFANNPQLHKEAGFDKGWPSRFDTWYKLAKELGFVWYWPDEKIAFSETGKMLLSKENPQNETIVFANAFAKYYRNNPFRTVLNSGTPLLLLIKTIMLMAEKDSASAGISKHEIPLLLCWHDDDADGLLDKIEALREQHGFSPSNETVLEICAGLIGATKRNDSSILTDYPDDFIRKMRLTGLITLRGGGRFIDINRKEMKAIEHLLATYKSPAVHATKKEFFQDISTLDQDFIATLTVMEAPALSTAAELTKWADHYDWEVLSREMASLAHNGRSEDEILKIIEQPLRLEFLTALAIRKKLPHVAVRPNYITDDEGLPTSFAPGGGADIVCEEDSHGVLIEVTLLRGTQQHIRESYSVQRHLSEYREKDAAAYSILITPQAYTDTVEHVAFVKHQKGLEVRVVDIDQFITGLATEPTLEQISSVYATTS